MKKIILKSAVVTALSMFMAGVQADGMGVGVAARYSTLGMGLEVGKSFTPHFGARLGLNQYSTTDNQNIDNIDYSTKVDLSSTGLMLDWYPLGGTFHLSAGYLNSNNKISASATPAGSVTIGTNTVSVNAGDLVLNSEIKLGSGLFYGLGWGNVPASGFGMTFELGVVNMGTPDVSLTFIDNTGTLGLVQADIDQEIANMKGDLDEFDTYPVIALGFSYGF